MTWLTDRDEVSRDKLRTNNRDPFAITESLNIVWCNAHRAELLESLDTLLTRSATARGILQILAWKTTVHSKTTSMKAVNRE